MAVDNNWLTKMLKISKFHFHKLVWAGSCTALPPPLQHLTFRPSSIIKTIFSLCFPETSFSEFLPYHRTAIFVSSLGTSSFWDLLFYVFCKFLLGLTVTHKHLIVAPKFSSLITTLLSRVLTLFFHVSFEHPCPRLLRNLKLNITQTDFSLWRSKETQFNTYVEPFFFPARLKETPFSTCLLKYNEGDSIYIHNQPFLHLFSPNVFPLPFDFFSHTILSKVSPSLKPFQLNTFPLLSPVIS